MGVGVGVVSSKPSLCLQPHPFPSFGWGWHGGERSAANVNGSRDRDLASNGRSDPRTFQNLRVEHVEGNQVCRYDLERLNLRDYRTAFILHEAQGPPLCREGSLWFLVKKTI